MDSWWGDISGNGLKKEEEKTGIRHQAKKHLMSAELSRKRGEELCKWKFLTRGTF